MDPVEVLPPWVPQDDLLLKNAVEAGASLESLAKGAVMFSRRYSLRELRDRWRSLLYDEDVATVAAAAMVNLELAKSGGSGEVGGKKRKVQSIRKQYYAMKKRIHQEGVVNSDVKTTVVGREDEEIVGIDGNLNSNSDVVNSRLVGYRNCLGLDGVRVEQLDNEVSDGAMYKGNESVSLHAMPVEVGVEDKSCGSEGTGKGDNGVMKLDAPNAVLGDDVTNIADCLLDMANEDELPFVNVEGKEEMAMDKDKPCCDNVDSHLLSSPCDVQGKDDADGYEVQKLNAETKLAVPSGCASDRTEVVEDNLLGGCHGGDQHLNSDSENNAGSSAAARDPHHENSEVLMICVLNTECPDVPSNDDCDVMEVSTVVPLSAALKSQPNIKELGCLDGSQKKEAIPSHSYAAAQLVQQGLVPLPNVNSSHRPVVLGLKTEYPRRNSMSAVSRQNVNSSCRPVVHATVMPGSDGNLKQEEIDAPASAEDYANAKAEEHKDLLSKSKAKSLSLDQEGGDIEDNDDNDDDDDDDDEILNFSDIETMILEMDLCPADQDTNASREVLRYQHEESKRTVMRLEQGAQSSMGRALTSRGAFAVLYGRILKKYIRKSKVILGRATADVQVDIDLGKEGEEARKISRRQALIKMEEDGSFIIQNLGKRSIFLNGKEIAKGQARGLSASSVIEIRGISLLFEINTRCVKRFLENEKEKK